MKKATNIYELVDNFMPGEPLRAEDSNVYVPIFEDVLSKLRDRIIYDKLESQTMFVSGQSGTGKTTALNFLSDEKVSQYYIIKTINFRDLCDLSDVNIIDILLMIGFEIARGTDLEDKYFDWLEESRKVNKGILIKENATEDLRKGELGAGTKASASTGFFDFLKLKGEFFLNYRLEKTYRNNAREAFELNKPNLLKTINRLITEYTSKIKNSKKLLLIIDDLDKLRDTEQIKSVFLENRFYILQLLVKKVIAIPVHLTTETEIVSLDVEIPTLCLRLKKNPLKSLNPEKENQIIEKNKNLLRKIVQIRIERDTRLIGDDAIEKAIQYSGGIIRHLISIINVAAAEARRLEAKRISIESTDIACQTIKTTFERPIINIQKIKFLDSIRKRHIAGGDPDSRATIDALLGNQIIAYSNGTTWYEVNPLIEETVEKYAFEIDKDEN